MLGSWEFYLTAGICFVESLALCFWHNCQYKDLDLREEPVGNSPIKIYDQHVHGSRFM